MLCLRSGLGPGTNHRLHTNFSVDFPGAYLAEIMDEEEEEFIYYTVRMLVNAG